jgi:hypothetical protein
MKDCCTPDRSAGKGKKIMNRLSSALIIILVVGAILATLIRLVTG